MTSDPRDVADGHDPSESEATRRVWDSLGAYPDEPVPAGFADRVMARVRSEPQDAAGAPHAPGQAGALDAATGGRAPLRVLAGGRFRGFAIAASLLAAVGAGIFVSQRFLVPPPTAVPTPTAALEAVPADLLDNESLVTLASLPEADFEALLLPDLADAEPLDAK